MTPLGVLFSGRGSNMVALVEAAAAGAFPGRVAVVVCNRPGSPGLELARRLGVEAVCVDHREFGGDRGAHEVEVDGVLRQRGVGLVCLAGYMRLFTPFFVGAWAGRMLNIHPSLLPCFPGLHPHRQALEAGVRLHGCTVHVVTEAMDSGPIVAQAAVPVLPGDDEDRLAARVLVQEHLLYPAAVRAFLGGAVGVAAEGDVVANAFPPAA